MKSFAHGIYFSLGKAVCLLCLVWWRLRDILFRREENTILFVAHPDDESLFFHTFIKREKPYVVVLFTGWSLKRLPCFLKAMKYYGVQYRIYPELSNRAYGDFKRRRITEKHVEECLRIGSFNKVLTHNASGEYGHLTHRLVHESVIEKCSRGEYEVICPVDRSVIDKYPLALDELHEKQYIFNSIYKSESWVMNDEKAGTPVWFYNEKHERVK